MFKVIYFYIKIKKYIFNKLLYFKDGHKRSMSVCFTYVAFSIGELLIWPMTLVTTNWRYFNLYFLAIPYLLLNCTYFLIKESPK